jgi:hypothetical protein
MAAAAPGGVIVIPRCLRFLSRLRGRAGVGVSQQALPLLHAPTRRAARVDLPRKRERQEGHCFAIASPSTP